MLFRTPLAATSSTSAFALGFPLLLYTLIFGPINMDPVLLSASFDIWMALLIITAVSVIIFSTGRVFNTARALLLTLLYLAFLVFIYYEILLNKDFVNNESVSNLVALLQQLWQTIRELLLGMW
jgi:hypothetical protein